MRLGEPYEITYCFVKPNGSLQLNHGADGGNDECQYTHAELLDITERLMREAQEAYGYVLRLIAAPLLIMQQAEAEHAARAMNAEIDTLRSNLQAMRNELDLSRSIASGELPQTCAEAMAR